MLGVLFPQRLPDGAMRRSLRLVAEASILTMISTWLPATLGFEEAGLLSLFLLTAALSDRLTLLLEENRTGIWIEGRSGWRANGRTAWGILLIFTGIFAGHVVIATTLGEARVAELFDFALRSAALGADTLERRDFGTVPELVAHNLRVLVVVGLLSFVYRAYGAMLAIAWNASVWAIALTVLWLRAPEGGTAVLAVVPHVLLEGLAYVTTALAFLFASKGLATHPVGDPALGRVLRACLVLLAGAGLALLLAAATEVWVAGSRLAS